MSSVTKLHEAVKHGDLGSIKTLLEENRAVANSRSETDARGTYPLHVAAEPTQQTRPYAARVRSGRDRGQVDEIFQCNIRGLAERRGTRSLLWWRRVRTRRPTRF